MWTRIILTLFCIGQSYACFCPNTTINLGCICAKVNQTLEIEQHPSEDEIKSGQCFQVINYAYFKHHNWSHIIYKDHNAFVKMMPPLYDHQPCGNVSTTTTLPTTTQPSTTGAPFSCSGFHIITPVEWGAAQDFLNQAELSQNITNVPQFAIVHHTDGIGCSTELDCKNRIKNDIQHWKLHQFNFAIGEDGNVYELNGWYHPGKHAGFYNDISVGIAFIGNFEVNQPNQKAMDALEHLLDCGTNDLVLDKNYILRAIRDINGGTSPGDALYNLITKMPHY